MGCRLDCICIALLIQFYGYIVSIEAGLWLVEAIVTQRTGAPEVLPGTVMVPDLGIELGGGMDASEIASVEKLWGRAQGCIPDVTIDQLGHGSCPIVAHEVECLCLDIGGVHDPPFEVISA